MYATCWITVEHTLCRCRYKNSTGQAIESLSKVAELLLPLSQSTQTHGTWHMDSGVSSGIQEDIWIGVMRQTLISPASIVNEAPYSSVSIITYDLQQLLFRIALHSLSKLMAQFGWIRDQEYFVAREIKSTCIPGFVEDSCTRLYFLPLIPDKPILKKIVASEISSGCEEDIRTYGIIKSSDDQRNLQLSITLIIPSSVSMVTDFMKETSFSQA